MKLQMWYQNVKQTKKINWKVEVKKWGGGGGIKGLTVCLRGQTLK